MEFDDVEDSPAYALWKERLEAYLAAQDGVEALRARTQPNPPWPDQDSPMVGYLLARSLEMYDEHGLEGALIWAIVHAWFEAAIDERATLIRQLGA